MSLRDGTTGTTPFELSQAQINDLIARHPDVQTIADQLLTMPTARAQQGLAYPDEVYGTVLISIDASDNIHYIGQAPAPASTYNQPTPSGVPQPNPLDPTTWITDLETFLQNYGVYALGALALYFFLSKEF